MLTSYNESAVDNLTTRWPPGFQASFLGRGR